MSEIRYKIPQFEFEDSDQARRMLNGLEIIAGLLVGTLCGALVGVTSEEDPVLRGLFAAAISGGLTVFFYALANKNL